MRLAGKSDDINTLLVVRNACTNLGKYYIPLPPAVLVDYDNDDDDAAATASTTTTTTSIVITIRRPVIVIIEPAA